MFINEYKIIKPSIDKEGYKAIEGFNGKDITRYVINTFGSIKCNGDRTALLYLSSGYPLSDNDTFLINEDKYKFDRECIPDTITYKRSTLLPLARWSNHIKGNIVYTDMVFNTCAAGVYALEKAKYLLESNKVDEVLIIGEVKINYTIMRLFKEYNVDLTLGEGAVFIRLSNKQIGQYIDEIKTHYEFYTNPFYVDSKGYSKVLSPADIVKPHSTFTEVNTKAENFLHKYDKVVTYKKDIGHTLGISSLLETCMLIDSGILDSKSKALIVASGMGGFYGSFTIQDYR